MQRALRLLRNAVAIAMLIALLLAYAWSEEIGIGARELIAGDQAVEARDGDTLLIGESVFRLAGIDAPEYRQSCSDAAGRPWRCGERARRQLEQLLDAPDLACTQRATDRFGRAVATCRTARTPDLGEAMVRAGMAISPARNGEAPYANAEEEARAARRGIWNGSFTVPATWREAHPRGTVDAEDS